MKSIIRRPLPFVAGLAFFALTTVLLFKTEIATAQAPAQVSSIIPEDTATKVSDHVYAIMSFPNIGIIVGSRATLVVDTGMGPRNGATVAREALKLGKNTRLYLTTTHFHPEHASGDSGFPADTILIRPVAQQRELEARGDGFVQRFRGMSAANKDLLQDVKFRTPDILFERDMTLDLGGVTARLFWMGAAHTQGDELIFVKEDRVLLPGDIVQNKLVPNMPDEFASAKGWLAVLDQITPLNPRFVVPDHGALGDGSLIAAERAYLADVQKRALELKAQGISADDAGKQLAVEFKTKYPEWTGNGVPNIVKIVYAETP